jgi:hypothetical protein
MEIMNGSSVYEVGNMVAEAEKYRLYLCIQKKTGRQCLLQIAIDVQYNGDLDRNAFVLDELRRISDKLEEEYAEVKEDSKDMLNYGLGFPELVDSFIYSEQGNRKVNILAFREVEDVSKMVPLANITAKDYLRVDLRTSVWIMGKLLKLLVLTQSEKISVESLLGSENILIEPDQHYVLIFDWTDAIINSEALTIETRSQEIAEAAQAVITVLGGNPEESTFIDDGEEAFEKYTNLLARLSTRAMSRAERAHEEFYELADSLWKREFYPFTTKPLTI